MANNIIKRVWNQGSMTPIEDLQGSAFTNENGGHTFQISGVDSNGESLALSGTIAASFLRPDQTTVGISGSVSGGVASVTLSEECYGVPGRFGLVIFMTSDGKKTAIYSCVGNVARSSTDAVAPGVAADVVDLINEIQMAVDTIPASYSALMADIAPTYSSSALYAVGDYAWCEGDLKRCIVPITVGETYTPAHWTSAVVGDDVSALKSAINTLDETVNGDPGGYTINLFNPNDPDLISTGYINQNNTYVQHGSFFETGYIACESGDTFTFVNDGAKLTGGRIVCYYDENKDFVSSNANAQMPTITIASDSSIKYFRISMQNQDKDTLMIVKNDTSIHEYVPYYIEPVPGLTDIVSEHGTEIDAITDATSSDVGKVLTVKTVEDGKVAEWQFSEPQTAEDTLSIMDKFSLLEGDYYTNKFDKDHITNGYINSDGTITTSGGWALTDYLPVRPGDVIRIVNNGALLSVTNASVGTYSANRTWISLVNGVGNPFTVPQDAEYRYIRFPFGISGVDTSKITVTINDTTLYTTPPTYHKQDSVFHLIDDNESDQDHVNSIYACSYFNSVPEQITVNAGGYLKSDGTVGTLSDTRFKYTDFIEIISTAYKVTVSAGSTPYGVCFYDKNQNFISYDLHTNSIVDYEDVTLTIPENARYFRLSSFITTPSTRKAIVINDLYSIVTENMGNNYIGKKCAQLGDSITWYDGHTQTIDGQTVAVKGYASYLREKGIVVDNYGVSGACITNLSTYTDVCETVDSIDFTEYDLCTIAAGVNDYDFWNSPIGDFANSSFDKGVFTQAYQYIIETILAQNKTIKIILCTPLQETHKTTANTQGKYLKDYADRIKEIGAYYSLPVLDLYNEGGLNKINMATLTIDNLHPNNDGYELVCEHSFVSFVISH